MKLQKWLAVVMALLVLFTAGIASGEIIRPMGAGQYGFDAVVLSQSVTVRVSPSTNAKSVKKLSFGDHVTVMSQGNGWCECFFSETEGVGGYIMEDYLLLNPAFITTEEQTPVYAWQDRSAKRVGFLGRGETLAIIRMDGNWLLISLRGAAGWIVRPGGDPTGTARMRTADVLKKAESYLLSMKPYTDEYGGALTAEKLKNFYIFTDYDASSRQWTVTFESLYSFYEVIIDDETGTAGEYESGNG